MYTKVLVFFALLFSSTPTSNAILLIAQSTMKENSHQNFKRNEKDETNYSHNYFFSLHNLVDLSFIISTMVTKKRQKK